MAKAANIQARILEIKKELIKGISREDIVSKYCKKFQLSVRQIDNYIEKANQSLKDAQQAKEKAINDEVVRQGVEAAKNGLKSKYERAVMLQVQANECEEELKEGTTTFVNDEGDLVSRKLTVIEKVQLRKVLRELNSELSKIEGDYAAIKQEHSGSLSFTDALKNARSK